ncbi:MAG: hypothetical protein HZA19_04700, partial [Nitrospirae bacterium]|nr:hypothetical protein [Nitrospirota bacterium]
MRTSLLAGILVVVILSIGCGSGGGGGNPTTEANTNTSQETSDGKVNTKPTAVLTGDINAKPGQVVKISGVDSSDPDGDTLAYKWSLIYSPDGSQVAFFDTDTQTISFVPDLVGLYKIQLIINDGALDSDPETIDIIVSTLNSAPIANAGKDRTVDKDVKVTLDGSESSDPDGDPLSFKWSIISSPPGSRATLANSDSGTPTFFPYSFFIGDYVIELIVNDGEIDSLPDKVTLTVKDMPPTTPSGLALSTGVDLDFHGIEAPWVLATWTTGGEADIREAEVSVRIGTESFSYFTSATSLKIQPVVPGATYYVKLMLRDKQGNPSAWTAEQSITVSSDILGPAVPAGLTLTTDTSIASDGTAFSWIKATWTANSETDFREYEIRLKNGAEGSYTYFYTKGTQATFQPVQAGATYYISLRAVDTQGNASAYTAEQSIVAAKDTTPPAVPAGLALSTGLALDNNGVTYAYITATWTANTEPDVTQYKLRIKEGMDGSYFYATSNTNDLKFVNVKEGTTYYIGCEAVDASGNESGFTVDGSIISAKDTTFSGSPLVTAFEIPPGENAIYLLTSNFGGPNEYVDFSAVDFTHQGAPLSIFSLSGTVAPTGDVFS